MPTFKCVRMGTAWIALAACSTAQAQDGSVKELFDKYSLFGTFAIDCAKPVGVNNKYWVHRPLDGVRVQRDQMSGATTRDFVVLFERASEIRPNEIAIVGSREGQPLNVVYRVERARMRALEATVGGKQEVVGGRFANGSAAPWLQKCSE